MTAPNIVWTRIDERLLHGQIRITWGKHTEANLILVANDDAAEGTECRLYASWYESISRRRVCGSFFLNSKNDRRYS